MQQGQARVMVAVLFSTLVGACGSGGDPDQGSPPVNRLQILLGVAPGDLAQLPVCTDTGITASCVKTHEVTPGDSGALTAFQVGMPARNAGASPTGSALLLAGRVESLGIVLTAPGGKRVWLSALAEDCGEAVLDNRLPVEGGEVIELRMWRCGNAWVTLNAMEGAAQWRASLVVSSDRAQSWLADSPSLSAAPL